MATRTKLRHAAPRRPRPAAVGSRTVASPALKRAVRSANRPGVEHRTPFVEPKPVVSPTGSAYMKATRYLSSLNDFEKLRIVRYNTQTFDLDRMRTLLKRLGNPHDQIKCVHVAGTKARAALAR